MTESLDGSVEHAAADGGKGVAQAERGVARAPSQAADDLITRVRIFDGLISLGGPVLLAGGRILGGGRLSAALGNVGPVCCIQPRATQQH